MYVVSGQLFVVESKVGERYFIITQVVRYKLAAISFPTHHRQHTTHNPVEPYDSIRRLRNFKKYIGDILYRMFSLRAFYL